MAMFKCKMCGGDLALTEGSTIAECEYCGSVQTVPKADDEKKLTLFARANRLRFACEFDKAAGVYEAIVADFPEEAEAYWGLVLCKYGIEYVDDPGTGKKIPTCHRSSFDSVLEDADFEQAQENADAMARRVYREEAKQFEQLRKDILEVSSNEPPYDIFICYKETDEKGDRTLDSVLAQDLYGALTDKGYRVFFSRITLQGKLGEAYEPYIFAALNSAKVMLAIGTTYEYYNAVWVKNEWSRYLKICQADTSKHLIPCYKDLDPEDMPKEFNHLQGADLSKMGAIQDILFNMEKYIPLKKEAAPETQAQASALSNPSVDSYLKRAFMFLEDEDWDNATQYCEKVLDIDPECAEAYLGKFMADMHVRNRENFGEMSQTVAEDSNYKKAIRFADENLKKELEAAIVFEPVYTGIIHSFEYAERKLLKSFVVPSNIDCIERYAFSFCENLTSIMIPSSVVHIGNGAFCYCNKITNIQIAPDNPVYTARGNCIIDKTDGSVIFGNASSVIPADGSISHIRAEAFSGTDGLKAIAIPDSVTNIEDNAFSNCMLTAIAISENVTNIGSGVFSGCADLNEITISPDNPRYVAKGNCIIDKTDGTVIFGNASSVIPVDGSVSHIGAWAFHNAFSLKTVTIPEGTVSIGEYAFEDSGLKEITIPSSVKSIGENAFAGCYDITIYAQQGSFAWQWAQENNLHAADWAVENAKQLLKKYKEAVKNEKRDIADLKNAISSLTDKSNSLSQLKNEWDQIESDILSSKEKLTENQSKVAALSQEKGTLGLFAGKRKKEIDQEVANLDSQTRTLNQKVKADEAKKLGFASAVEVDNAIEDLEQQLVEKNSKLENLSRELPSAAMRAELAESWAGSQCLNEYEAMLSMKEGDIVRFGKYEQDANASTRTDIEWKVLEREGSRALLLSKYNLDCHPYHKTSQEFLTWEKCDLRRWLNNDFLQSAFSESEQAAIATTTVSPEKNPKYPESGQGRATNDKLFLLSIAEVDKYFPFSFEKQGEPTDYVTELCKSRYDPILGKDGSWWWLRTRGGEASAACVASGYIEQGGWGVKNDTIAVRPAMWIDLDNI